MTIQVQDNFDSIKSAKDFGCKFDGVTDDTVALTAAIQATIVNGYDLVLPPGVAVVSSKLSFNGGIGTVKKFRIRGSGQYLSIIKRASGANNQVLEFDNFSIGFCVEDFSLDGSNVATHCLVIYNSSHIRLNDLYYGNFSSCGFLCYADTGSNQSDVVARRCHAYGGDGGAGSVGQMYANMLWSGFEDCTAENILTAPAYALELKNACQYCWIRGGWGKNSGTAVAFGQDTATTSVIDSWVYGTSSYNCQNGFVSGYSQRCSVSMPFIDMNDNYANGDAVHLAQSLGLSVTIGVVKNVKRNASYFDGSTTDCLVEINEIYNDLGVGCVAYFDAGSDRNATRLKKFSLPATIAGTLYTNLGGAENSFTYDPTAGGSNFIYPSGAANISAQTPDNIATGGSSRGTGAVDFQVSRTNPANVASGNYSCIPGGQDNKATSSYSAAFGALNVSSGIASLSMGANCLADGAYSQAFGRYASTKGTYGKRVMSSGRFSITGDAQIGEHVLRAITTSSTPANITSDQGALSASNSIPIPDNSIFYITGKIIARDINSNDASVWDVKMILKRRSGVATTSLMGSATITNIASDTSATTWGVSISADAANGGISVLCTGQNSKTIHWVSHLQSVEIQ